MWLLLYEAAKVLFELGPFFGRLIFLFILVVVYSLENASSNGHRHGYYSLWHIISFA